MAMSARRPDLGRRAHACRRKLCDVAYRSDSSVDAAVAAAAAAATDADTDAVFEYLPQHSTAVRSLPVIPKQTQQDTARRLFLDTRLPRDTDTAVSV